MTSVSDEIFLKEIVEDYINIMQEGNEENFVDLWHPQARQFNIGNSNELFSMDKNDIIKNSLRGLKNFKKQLTNPEIIRFQIDEIISIRVIEGLIASVELKWHMILPGSKGTHHTFIQFAKHNKKWFIINVLDRGLEKELK